MYEFQKEAFHFAKLALFNVRFLCDVEDGRRREPVIDRLVRDRIENDEIGDPVSFLHQATYLQFAYISLVWLWENAKQSDEVRDAVVKCLPSLFDFQKAKKVSGPRELRTPCAVLRLLRNAISHGRVVAKEGSFIFSDIGKGEYNCTTVELSWADLGLLSECMLWAWNRILWPELYQRPV